jgi:hypothetical protein
MIAKSVLFAAKQNPPAQTKNAAAKTNLTFMKLKPLESTLNALAISGGREAAVRLHRLVGRHRQNRTTPNRKKRLGLLMVHKARADIVEDEHRHVDTRLITTALRPES